MGANKQQKILNFNRLQCLFLYRWIIVLDLFIIYKRCKYLSLTLILIGLSECNTFILCCSHLITEYFQNTHYLKQACLITVFLSHITIILSALRVVGCIYYRWIYWIIHDGKHMHQIFLDHIFPNLVFESIHILSFVGIFVINVWWTISLNIARKNIPITFHETKLTKKNA